MNKQIKELIGISHYYGTNLDFIIAAGGNTSFKNEKHIFVKASGIPLGIINNNGFIQLDRSMAHRILSKKYSNNPEKRANEIKKDLLKSKINIKNKLRPSVETLVHEAIGYNYIVHTHPYFINALICSKNAKKSVEKLFGPKILYLKFTEPGYILAKTIDKEIALYRKKYKEEPHIIMLGNHGIFIGANTIKEIKELYSSTIGKIKKKTKNEFFIRKLAENNKLKKIIPELKKVLPGKAIETRHNTLIAKFYISKQTFNKVSKAFTPDHVVYCRAEHLYINETGPEEKIIKTLKTEIKKYKNTYKYLPKIIAIKNIGYIGAEDSKKGTEIALNTFEEIMKISYYSENFGGPEFLPDKTIKFIDNWEVEKYRRKLGKIL